MAKYVHGRQVEQVAEGLDQVYSRVKGLAAGKVPVVVTGMGKDFLARAAAQKIGADKVFDLEKLCLGDAFVYRVPESAQNDVTKASPAVGVALMTASKLERRPVKWTQL